MNRKKIYSIVFYIVLLGLIVNFLSIKLSLLTKDIIETIQLNINESRIFSLKDNLIYFLITLISGTIFNALYNYFAGYYQSKIQYSLRKDIVDNYSKSNMLDMKKINYGEILGSINYDIDIVGETLANNIPQLIVGIVGNIIYLIIFYRINYFLFLILLSLNIIFLIVILLNKKYSFLLFKQISKNSSAYMKKLKDIISYRKLLRFYYTDKLENDFINEGVNLLTSYQKEIRASSLFSPLMDSVKYVVLSIVIYNTINFSIEIPTIYLFIEFMNLTMNNTNKIVQIIHSVQGYNASKIKLDKIKNLKKENQGLFVDEIIKKISLENVSFRYSSDDNFVINNSNLSLYKGRSYLILGESGTGKSTLVSLLLGLLVPSSGKISINDTDIKNWNLEYLRKRSGICLDSPIISKKDIRCYNKNFSKMKELINLNLYPFKHIDNLSDSEQQLVSLVNILLDKNIQIIVLDETTKAINPKVEEQLINKIIQKKDAIVIIISHKLNLCELVDEIIYFKNTGDIIINDHKALYNNCSEYNNFLKSIREKNRDKIIVQ